MALKSAEQLASEMRTGNVKVNNRLKQKPFFEKAMERVLEQLQRKETKYKPKSRTGILSWKSL